MAIVADMTWNKKQKRWSAKYRNKVHFVSPRQLGCPATRDQSVLAANLWWAAKKSEIDAAVLSPIQAARTALVAELVAVDTELQAAGVRSPFLTSVTYPPPTGSIGELAEQWIADKKIVGVAARNCSHTRLQSYRREVGYLVAYYGPDAPAAYLVNLKRYFAHLTTKLSEGLAPATAATRWMTAKQFAGWVVREGAVAAIPALTNPALVFGVPNEVPEVPTVAEVRELLAAATDPRHKLFILLMLNCGLYQSDISDIGRKEVDLVAGTLTRQRSKTRGKSRRPVLVRYKLWPETLELLRQEMAKTDVPTRFGDVHFLLSERGTPLVRHGESGRCDNIGNALNALRKKAGIEIESMGLRKVGSTILKGHKDHRWHQEEFLGRPPATTTQKSYDGDWSPDDEFFAATDWLREQILGGS